MAILMWDNLAASEADVSKWNSDALQAHTVRVQTPAPLLIMNVYACNGKDDMQR